MKGTMGIITACCTCLLFLSSSPCLGVQLFLDGYDPAPAAGNDLKNIQRTPDTGPPGSWALWSSHDSLSTAQTATALDGISAAIKVPPASAMDYQGWLGGNEYTGRFLLQWSIIVDAISPDSNDLGLFSVRFPTATSGMQILFSFMNNGRLITFDSNPHLFGLDSIVPAGTYLADTRYDVDFMYDLIEDTYSVSMNGVLVIANRLIPDYLDRTSIDQFGFDISQSIQLDGSPLPAGNKYYVDNISLSHEPVYEPVPEPATILLFGTGIVCLAGSRLRRKNK